MVGVIAAAVLVSANVVKLLLNNAKAITIFFSLGMVTISKYVFMYRLVRDSKRKFIHNYGLYAK